MDNRLRCQCQAHESVIRYSIGTALNEPLRVLPNRRCIGTEGNMRDRLRRGAVMVPKQRTFRTELVGFVFVDDDVQFEGARCLDALRR